MTNVQSAEFPELHGPGKKMTDGLTTVYRRYRLSAVKYNVMRGVCPLCGGRRVLGRKRDNGQFSVYCPDCLDMKLYSQTGAEARTADKYTARMRAFQQLAQAARRSADCDGLLYRLAIGRHPQDASRQYANMLFGYTPSLAGDTALLGATGWRASDEPALVLPLCAEPDQITGWMALTASGERVSRLRGETGPFRWYILMDPRSAVITSDVEACQALGDCMWRYPGHPSASPVSFAAEFNDTEAIGQFSQDGFSGS
jgi:hypothetical protein